MKTQTISIHQKPFRAAVSLFLFVLISLITVTANAQSTERTLTGIVKTFAGPIPDVTVILKGTSTFTMTDEKGAFTFPKQLKENDVLIISTLAYKDLEVVINGNTSFIEPELEGTEIVVVAA